MAEEAGTLIERGDVLRQGGTEVPAGIKHALKNTNQMQDLVFEHLRPGRSGNEVLADALAAMKAEGHQRHHPLPPGG